MATEKAGRYRDSTIVEGLRAWLKTEHPSGELAERVAAAMRKGNFSLIREAADAVHVQTGVCLLDLLAEQATTETQPELSRSRS
jgi:hypothetical protein